MDHDDYVMVYTNALERNWRGKRWNELGSQEPTQKRNNAFWSLARRQHTDVHSLAANSRLKSHPLSKYMDSSSQLKDEDWFLRMCHFTL